MNIMEIENERAYKVVRPAGKKAKDYLDWFLESVNGGGNVEETMDLILQHTQAWGVSQGILHEMSRFEELEQEYKNRHKGLLGKKEMPEDVQQKFMIAKTVFLCELLNQIFIKDTNFAEVVYGSI